MKALLLAGALALQLGDSQEHSLDHVGSATYTCTFGNRATGREQVLFGADGWRTEYEARWKRTGAASGEWEMKNARGSFRCVWSADSISVASGEAAQPTARADWQHEAAPVFFANGMWTVFSHGRSASRAADPSGRAQSSAKCPQDRSACRMTQSSYRSTRT